MHIFFDSLSFFSKHIWTAFCNPLPEPYPSSINGTPRHTFSRRARGSSSSSARGAVVCTPPARSATPAHVERSGSERPVRREIPTDNVVSQSAGMGERAGRTDKAGPFRDCHPLPRSRPQPGSSSDTYHKHVRQQPSRPLAPEIVQSQAPHGPHILRRRFHDAGRG